MIRIRTLVLSALVVLVGCVWARPGMAGAPDEGVAAERIQHQRRMYEVVRVDLTRARLRLFWQDPEGERFRTFERLDRWLDGNGRRLVFAANAGIFERDYTPLGLHVENGREKVVLNLKSGDGNFYLKPNGVFFVSQGAAHVVRADRFKEKPENLTLATQSGPLLLEDGTIHPAFEENSKHRKIRSAVGIKSPQEAVFVLSLVPVTFHELAAFYRDYLECKDALYLDGEISEFYQSGKESGSPLEEDFVGILGVVGDEEQENRTG